MTQAHDQFLFDIFVTAIEDGCTNSWRQVEGYHWTNDAGETEDLQGFHVTVIDLEDNSEHIVNRQTIVTGLAKLLRKGASVDLKVHSHYINEFRDAYAEKDAGNIDAYSADMVLQAGIFGKIIYG